MICSLELTNFKNFHNRVEVVISDNDSAPFTVIVGPNGTGKSAIIDAIQWGLFGIHGKELRIKRIADLANKIDELVEVVVRIKPNDNDNDNDIEGVECYRSFDGNRSDHTTHLRFKDGSSRKTKLVADLENILRLNFSSDMFALRRVIISQMESFLVAKSPLDILHHLESYIGTKSLLEKLDSVEDLEKTEQVIFSNTLKELRIGLEKYQKDLPTITSIGDWLERKKTFLRFRFSYLHQNIESSRNELTDYTMKLESMSLQKETLSEQIGVVSQQLLSLESESKSHLTTLSKLRNRNKSLDNDKEKILLQKLEIDESASHRRHVIKTQYKLLSSESQKKNNLQAKLENGLKLQLKLQHEQKSNDEHVMQKQSDLCKIFSEIPEVELYQLQEAKTQEQEFINKLIQTKEDMQRIEVKIKELSDVETENTQIKKSAEEISTKVLILMGEIGDIDRSTQNMNCHHENLKKTLRKAESSLISMQHQLLDSKRKSSENSQLLKIQQFSNEIRKEFTDDYFGFLFELISPITNSYALPIASVLGRKLISTMLVSSRAIAVLVIERAKRHNFHGIDVQIIAEQAVSKKPPCRLNSFGSINLINCINYPECIEPYVRKQLSNWILSESNQMSESFVRIHSDYCIVNLRGNKVLNGWEILLCDKNLRKDCWNFSYVHHESESDGIQLSLERLQYEIQSISSQIDSSWKTIQAQVLKRSGLNDNLHILRMEESRQLSRIQVDAKKELENLQINKERILSRQTHLNSKLSKVQEVLKELKDLRLRNLLKVSTNEYSIDHVISLFESFSASKAQASIIASKKEKSELVVKQAQQSFKEVDNNIMSLQEKIKKMELELNAFVDMHHDVLRVCNERCHMIEEEVLSRSKFMANVDEKLNCCKAHINEKQEYLKEKKYNLAKLRSTIDKLEKSIKSCKANLQVFDFEVLEVEQSIKIMDNSTLTIFEPFEDVGDFIATLLNRNDLPIVSSDNDQAYDLNLAQDFDWNVESMCLERSLKSLCLKLKLDREEDLQNKIRDYNKKTEIVISSICKARTSVVTLQNISRERSDLEDERFYLLRKNFSQINNYLHEIYSKLVPRGYCQLSYPNNRVSLFRDGVDVIASHECSPLVNIKQLSGGQQTACGIAVLLALQLLHPSPLYIFDEIDSNLDSRTVANLGVLLLESSRQSKTQYIVISHRQEMQQYAQRVVGLYTFNQQSRILHVSHKLLEEDNESINP